MPRTQILEDSSTEKLTAVFSRKPSSCNVTLYDANGNELTASAAATLGASTTVNGDCGWGQTDRRQIKLTSVASLVYQGTYLLINAASQREIVQLISLPASGICEIDRPLMYAYVNGDTFESCEVTRTLTADETADFGRNYRARFIATMPDSSVETVDVIYDVVKHKIEQPITARNLHQYDSDLIKHLPHSERGTEWEEQLNNAFDLVFQDLVTEGLQPDKYMDTTRLAQLHLYRFKQALFEGPLRNINREEFALQEAKYFGAQYRALLAECVKKSGWYDHGADLVPANETVPAFRRRVI
jgi:hypothetical protein